MGEYFNFTYPLPKLGKFFYYFLKFYAGDQVEALITIWLWMQNALFARIKQFKLLDVLALPQYTNRTGAEEHWGLIHVYYSRELVDPRYATAAIYMDAASVCAHETIHQVMLDNIWTLPLNSTLNVYYLSKGSKLYNNLFEVDQWLV